MRRLPARRQIVEQGSTITADDTDDDASRHGSQVALRERV